MIAAWPCPVNHGLPALVLMSKFFDEQFLEAKSHTFQEKKRFESWDLRSPVKFGIKVKNWSHFCTYVCTVAARPRRTNPGVKIWVLIQKFFYKQFLKAKSHSFQEKKRFQSWDYPFFVKFFSKVKILGHFLLTYVLSPPDLAVQILGSKFEFWSQNFFMNSSWKLRVIPFRKKKRFHSWDMRFLVKFGVKVKILGHFFVLAYVLSPPDLAVQILVSKFKFWS